MFYRTRRILRTLLLPITSCSEGCNKFTSFAEIENWLQNWIASKDESFFRDRIRKLPERWEKVVGSDGQYFNWSVHSYCFEINTQKTELISTINMWITKWTWNNYSCRRCPRKILYCLGTAAARSCQYPGKCVVPEAAYSILYRGKCAS